MPISFRRSVRAGILPALLLGLISLPASQASGQDTPSNPGLTKQLNRIDFAISAAGQLNSSVSGIEQRDATTSHSVLNIKPSNSVGELFALRYIARPYVGFEFNIGNARTTENYIFTPPPTQNLLFGGAQTSVREMTLGYVAHPGFHPFGLQPFVGVGGGTIRFKPTPGGGQGLPYQYRAAYYYSVGVEDTFPSSHFGYRIGFRQLIFLEPDFLQNYLTITRRGTLSEPTIGLFVRF